MSKRFGLYVLFLVSTFYAQTLLAGNVYYVQSTYAKILSDPSLGAKVITVAANGDQLTSTNQEGNWIKVNFRKQEGYVYSLLVSTHPPLKKNRFISANDPEIYNGVRRRSSTFLSAAAARGLTKEDHNRADTEDEVDFVALKKMEALVLSDSEIDQFLKSDK